MGSRIHERVRGFFNNRWLVFVAAMWLQSVAGIGYLFGSISPVIKSSLSYNQREISRLGVAKDLGDSVGFFAGSLCEYLPLWAALFIGALKNFVGYGWIWLIVTGRLPVLPLWAMCVLVFVGTNGETYFNTASLVSCVQNFPKSRGPVVGILKGFAGLSGAIMTQIYAMMNAPDHASIIFMVAVAPSMVAIALMFFVRPVGGHRQVRPSDGRNFTQVYSMCLLLAAYLMGVMLVQDLISVAHVVVTIFTAILFIVLFSPILIPVSLSFYGSDARAPEEEGLLGGGDHGKSALDPNEVILSEVESEVESEAEDERRKGVDALNASDRQKRIAQLQTKLLQAAAEGAVRVKRRRGPRRGENFTLMQALIKADFWLLFTALTVGSGSGLTVIDNLGQISQSLRYENAHIFVSLISIWNFLGRIGGGYLSEIVVSKYAYPRPVALAVAQLIMALGHIYVGLALPGALYVGTVIIGLCYGAHWAIVPATASELFGVRNFGALYNFITVANPVGTLIFSSLIASSIYDREAERQAHQHNHAWSYGGSFVSGFLGEAEPPKCYGSVCFFLTLMIMAGFCLVGIVVCMTLVHRTKTVYAQLYGNSRTSAAS